MANWLPLKMIDKLSESLENHDSVEIIKSRNTLVSILTGLDFDDSAKVLISIDPDRVGFTPKRRKQRKTKAKRKQN